MDIKGNKEVIIFTERNENKRISLLLSVSDDRSKLAPFYIFQDDKEKSI